MKIKDRKMSNSKPIGDHHLIENKACKSQREKKAMMIWPNLQIMICLFPISSPQFTNLKAIHQIEKQKDKILYYLILSLTLVLISILMVTAFWACEPQKLVVVGTSKIIWQRRCLAKENSYFPRMQILLVSKACIQLSERLA